METPPYLSVVVTTRNDDHGGNLLERTQTFVNALLAQCEFHALPTELIVVEWNPPGERRRLAEMIQWPRPNRYCEVRVVEVPGEVHARYRHSHALPLYQMIAKNAGIRRAIGEFVLATNIDILFSDELMRFIADRRLKRGKMYRVDRYDVMSDVPVDASVEERLAYCSSHLIRVNTEDGTFRLSEEGPRPLQSSDIATPDSGISFQSGWYERELDGGRPFRWVNNDAEIRLEIRDHSANALVLDLEPGPGTGWGPFVLEVQGYRIPVEQRSIVRVPLDLAASSPMHLRLHVEGGGQRIASDLRTLNFRVFRCKLIKGHLHRSTVQPVRSLKAWAGRMLKARLAQAQIQPAEPMPSPILPHTNACGDFTLLAREDWIDLRAYPELELFSMNIDALFCCAAHFGGVREEILEDPMRIYHIEHESGWTPDGQKEMYDRLEAKGVPWLEYTDVLRWARDMDRLKTPLIFNRADWGLAGEPLNETLPLSS